MINENGLLNIFPTAEASGSIVSFGNGADGIPMESLSVAIDPTQDLHGYANPWPGGGGKNKLHIEDKDGGGITGSYNSAGEYVITGTAGSVAVYCDFTNVTLPAGSYTFSISALPTGLAAVYTKDGAWAGIVTDGKVITLTAEATIGGYISVPAETEVNATIKIQLESGSSATAWTPYSNICPISGRTGVDVQRTGKNLFDVAERVQNQTNAAGAPSSGYTLTNGVLSISKDLAYYGRVMLSAMQMVSGTYTLSFTVSKSGSGKIMYSVRNMNTKTDIVGATGSESASITRTFTVTSDTLVAISIQPEGSAVGTVSITDIQIELGSTATAYEPYQGNTYAVDWSTQAGTVYGGTLDVVTGVLTVDRALVDMGERNYTKGNRNTDNTGYVFYFRDTSFKNNGELISSQFKEVLNIPNWESLPVNCCNSANGSYIVFCAEYADAATFKIAMSGVQLCYELATPLTYQLTAQEVATLLRANNVWSDAGDISLVYHAQADATPSSIDGLFINGEGLQAKGWFLKWRKLAAPNPKTDYISVWGRDGDIDLTENETDGQVFYENRELTMDMVYIGDNWTQAYSELLDLLHGEECAVQFSNDPYWYWAGRIIASLYEHKPHSLDMSGIMFPYKLSVAKITKSATVSGAIESNGVEVVLPSSRMRVSPKVTVVAGTGESVTLKWGTKTQTLSAGTYYVRGLKVGSDDVTIKVWGTGTVNFEYRKGML